MNVRNQTRSPISRFSASQARVTLSDTTPHADPYDRGSASSPSGVGTQAVKSGEVGVDDLNELFGGL